MTDHCLKSRDYVNVIVAGKQPAAADGDQQGIQFGYILEHFQRHGALPGHDVAVVVGVDQGHALAFDQLYVTPTLPALVPGRLGAAGTEPARAGGAGARP